MNHDTLTLSIPQAAKRLGVGRDAMRELVAADKIPYVMIGTRTKRIAVAELEKWLAKNSSDAA